MTKEQLQEFLLEREYKKYCEKVLDITPQELRDRVEDCVMAYGMIMTKDGKVLTVEEMEQAFKALQDKK